MSHTPARLSLNPRYDGFLHAIVGDDVRGTSVTVLSMLARLGLDPWKEPSDLAAMPEGPARQRLDALMARFRDVPSLDTARAELVSRLLAFLPEAASTGPTGPDGKPARQGLMIWGIPARVRRDRAVSPLHLSRPSRRRKLADETPGRLVRRIPEGPDMPEA